MIRDYNNFGCYENFAFYLLDMIVYFETYYRLKYLKNFQYLVCNVGTLDEHMHLLLPALIRLFKVDASVDIRGAAIKTLTRLIPRVQVGR